MGGPEPRADATAPRRADAAALERRRRGRVGRGRRGGGVPRARTGAAQRARLCGRARDPEGRPRRRARHHAARALELQHAALDVRRRALRSGKRTPQPCHALAVQQAAHARRFGRCCLRGGPRAGAPPAEARRHGAGRRAPHERRRFGPAFGGGRVLRDRWGHRVCGQRCRRARGRAGEAGKCGGAGVEEKQRCAPDAAGDAATALRPGDRTFHRGPFHPRARQACAVAAAADAATRRASRVGRPGHDARGADVSLRRRGARPRHGPNGGLRRAARGRVLETPSEVPRHARRRRGLRATGRRRAVAALRSRHRLLRRCIRNAVHTHPAPLSTTLTHSSRGGSDEAARSLLTRASDGLRRALEPRGLLARRADLVLGRRGAVLVASRLGRILVRRAHATREHERGFHYILLRADPGPSRCPLPVGAVHGAHAAERPSRRGAITVFGALLKTF